MKVLIRLLVCVTGATLAASAFNACGWKRTPIPDSSPAQTVNLPQGCADNFSGAWVHADDPSYTYLAQDDGGSLVLTAFRLWVTPDGGMSADAGAPAHAATVTLSRTARGFTGTTSTQTVHPTSGRTCSVGFPTEVIRCDDGGLTLKSATVTSVGEACQLSPSTVAPIMLEHRLARTDAGAL